jgi:hypothetical protein
MVVNLFGAPSAGKSTGAAYIFAKLKLAGVNAELVTEFAKDKVWEETKAVFKNQLYIFGKQSFKISKCYDKVDVVITDSPLYASKLYNNFDGKKGQLLDALVIEEFNSYENRNYFINRVKPYNPVGRFQTEDESDKIATQLRDMLYRDNISYDDRSGNEAGYDSIVKDILAMLGKE